MKESKYKDGDIVYNIKIVKLHSDTNPKKCLIICPICKELKETWRANLLQGKLKSCGCSQRRKREWQPHKFLDLSGQTFGDLYVIQRDLSNIKRVNFLCKCKCGETKSIFSHYLTSGKSRTCGCSKYLTGSRSNSWKGCGDITGHHFAHIRNQAKIRSLEFNLTIEYLWELFKNQNQKCNLTDLPLSFVSNKIQSRTASLDRIDNDKGYIEGNVQWIHKDINYMKRTLSQTRLIDYCRLIINKHPNNA